jgi:hypothetical protein
MGVIQGVQAENVFKRHLNSLQLLGPWWVSPTRQARRPGGLKTALYTVVHGQEF